MSIVLQYPRCYCQNQEFALPTQVLESWPGAYVTRHHIRGLACLGTFGAFAIVITASALLYEGLASVFLSRSLNRSPGTYLVDSTAWHATGTSHICQGWRAFLKAITVYPTARCSVPNLIIGMFRRGLHHRMAAWYICRFIARKLCYSIFYRRKPTDKMRTASGR